MRTPDHIMYNTVDQQYQKKSTPSRHMAHESLRRDEREGVAFDDREKYDLLEAREAAEAAKPFMDVAVALHTVDDEVKGGGTGELTSENKILIEYAEQRARLAAEKGEAREMSDAEQKILNVYEAEAEAAKVKLELGEIWDAMGPEDVLAAEIEADDRFNQAKTREERGRWKDMSLKLEKYRHFLESGQDDQYKEFSTDTEHASYVLQRMDAETGETTELGGEPLDDKKLMIQAKNLRSEADMLRFVGSHMKLENDKKMIAGINVRS